MSSWARVNVVRSRRCFRGFTPEMGGRGRGEINYRVMDLLNEFCRDEMFHCL
jgi:hypothetical protein